MSSNEQHLCVILTGGTICTQPSAKGFVPTKNQLLSKCLAVNPLFNDASIPPLSTLPTIVDERHRSRPADASFILPTSEGERSIRYTAFEFHDILESSDADSSHWNKLARCVLANEASFDAFVILHGTDTLAYSASALSFLLHSLDKQVVLTGSQVSMFEEASDAWDNVLGALHAACAKPGPFQAEVSIYFNGTLHRGNRSTKIHASDFAGFASPNADKQAIRRHELAPHLKAAGNTPAEAALVSLHSPDAAIIRIFPGISPVMIEAILAMPGLKGLIVETYGAGHMPSSPSILNALKKAITDNDLVVVNVSQCLTGTVTRHYAPARALEEIGVLCGYDMTTEAAYTKLLWLLAQRDTIGSQGIRSLMTRNLCGELTEPSFPKVPSVNTMTIAQTCPGSVDGLRA